MLNNLNENMNFQSRSMHALSGVGPSNGDISSENVRVMKAKLCVEECWKMPIMFCTGKGKS